MRISTDDQRFFNSSANFKHVQNFPTNLNNRSCWFRRCTNPKTKGNYDLLSVTIANDIEKNAFRKPSQAIFQAIRLGVRGLLSLCTPKALSLGVERQILGVQISALVIHMWHAHIKGLEAAFKIHNALV